MNNAEFEKADCKAIVQAVIFQDGLLRQFALDLLYWRDEKNELLAKQQREIESLKAQLAIHKEQTK